MNDATYEVKGEHSIQSMLERNMWLLNEEWWIIQSNKPLKKFIQEENNLRPDFICATYGDRLIIVDIKRPSHNITKADIDQVENYKIIAKHYAGTRYQSITVYLIGKKIPDTARSIVSERRNITLLTYNDLTDNIKHKYKEYLHYIQK